MVWQMLAQRCEPSYRSPLGSCIEATRNPERENENDYIVKPWTHPNCLSLWLWKRFASRIVWITLVRVGLPCRVKVPAPRFNLGADNFFCSWKLVLTLWSKFKASTPWPSGWSTQQSTEILARLIDTTPCRNINI